MVVLSCHSLQISISMSWHLLVSQTFSNIFLCRLELQHLWTDMHFQHDFSIMIGRFSWISPSVWTLKYQKMITASSCCGLWCNHFFFFFFLRGKLNVRHIDQCMYLAALLCRYPDSNSRPCKDILGLIVSECSLHMRQDSYS